MYRRQLLSIALLILLVPAVFAGTARSAIPNWSVLENRLFENPRVVLNELKTKEIDTWPDTQKVQYYDLLSAAYLIFSDYQSAEEALNLGWALKDSAEPYVLVDMITTHGYFNELNGEFDKALSDYQTALQVAEQRGSFDAMLVAINALISYYSFSQEQYDKALEYVDRGTAISNSVAREFLIGDLYNYFGSILSYLGDSDGAQKQYEYAESIYFKNNNAVSLTSILYNRALLYEDSEDYISALRTYRAFMDEAELWGDPTAEFFGNMGIANSYNYLESYEQAYQAMLAAKKAIQYIADPVYLFDYWNTTAYIAADVEDFTLAEEAIGQTELLIDQVADSDQSWYHIKVLNSQKYLAKLKQDFETAFGLSEDVRKMQIALLQDEMDQALTLQRINSENAMYQSETDRLATESRRQQEVIAAKNQLQQIFIILLVMLSVSLVALGITLRRKIRQMRILQQYSAISESVKTSGQRVMENIASLMFDQSERRKSPLSVLVFDFNTMADVREQFGQQAVDDANHWIKETLDCELREEDKCGQLSFDRYMMLVPGAEVKLARKKGDRILQFFHDNPVPNWPDVTLEVSVGISERSRHDRNPNVLTHRATTAVDMARDSGSFNVKVLAV